jgi:hypothetical protein
MLEPILFGSKILFLVLLYLFIFLMVRRLSSDLKRGVEPIGIPSRQAPVVAPAPRTSAPRQAPSGTPAASAAPAMPPVAPVTKPAPRRERERVPETAPAPAADSSTREFDYLVNKLSPRLVVQHSKVIDDGTVFEVKGGATIGRSHRSQIVLPDEFVSSTHARIFARKQFLYLEDLGSTNGTFIDGRRLEGERQIKPGQEIVIGDTIFRFEE